MHLGDVKARLDVGGLFVLSCVRDVDVEEDEVRELQSHRKAFAILQLHVKAGEGSRKIVFDADNLAAEINELFDFAEARPEGSKHGRPLVVVERTFIGGVWRSQGQAAS